MQVIVAEKPSVAREIAAVLGARDKADGYIGGRGVKVTWAFGHLVDYAYPEAYPGWEGRWRDVALPMVPEEWRLEASGDGEKQLGIIKRLMQDADEVVCATDAGREGEHIFRLIVEYCGVKKPLRRLWISSLTAEAIEKGLRSLHEGREFEPLAAAAKARDQADWLLGINLTRAYTVAQGTLCSVGRVQTPTLAMVVKRDRDVENFVKETYFEVVAELEGFKATHVYEVEEDDGRGKTKTKWETRLSASEADALVERCWKREATVEDVTKREKRTPPPQLFDLTSLQREANGRFGWPAAKTLEVAQSLYEAKILTYPRTECRHLPEDMRESLAPTLKSLVEADVRGARQAQAALEKGYRPGKRYLDSTKLTDHHAIVPTGVLPKSVASFSDTDSGVKLFRVVAERYAGMFLADRVQEETVVWLSINGVRFRARGLETLSAGWTGVLGVPSDDGDETAQDGLPELFPDSEVAVRGVGKVEKETKPPGRYTEATLLGAMKNAGRLLEGDDRTRLSAAGGIGTPATRASIIETLLKRDYVVRDKKRLVSTQLGRALVDIVHPRVRDVALTAAWERELGEIEETDGGGVARGKAAVFYGEIVAFLKEVVPEIAGGEQRMQAVQGTQVGPCPECGRPVVETKKAYSCVGWRNEGDRKCTFVIWKTHLNKVLTVKQVRDVLAGKKVLVKQFRSKKGNVFDAHISLSLGGQNNLTLDFGGNGARGGKRGAGKGGRRRTAS